DRPDFVGLSLSKGKIVILVDQNPFAIIGPSSFLDFFLTSEDYIFNTWTANFLRVLRVFGYFSSLLLVPVYVAFTTHHYEGFPIEVLFIVIESRSEVPFPPVGEAFLMLITMEFLKEASKRMPTKTGNTLGVVGGIIIGDAAVQAGLASNILIVLVGITAVSSFLVPNYIMGSSTIILRYLLLLIAYAYGMFGIVAAFCGLVIYLNSKRSIMKPYIIPKMLTKDR
ncbi:spore germination protein, partial [Metabacillus sp. YM-086]|uniref:spore germination protein n=1 Tax=Metabacillus sp. YM-086 TaxID=3341729 RepID=UPI003A84164D